MFTRLLSSTLFHRRRAPLAVVCVLSGCASSNDSIERLKDGSYRLECREPLAHCLALAEARCSNYGYEVLSARQENRVFGPEQLQTQYVNSEAVVMCRNADSLVVDDPQPSRAVASGKAPQTASKAQTCVPGASQSCTGSGGCKGGQSCAPDGLSYLPCDCGSSGATQEVVPVPSPSTTAGVSAPPAEPIGAQGSAHPPSPGSEAPAPVAPALSGTAPSATPAPSTRN